ncbi:hypothetical protein [Nocardia beijingensis]|uniref:hypothetical protein n=1 Tax=Nocardia beijingensis TaxID=95162 RepID=UPI001FD007C8|nr:hypothetical protein [Nocardia beijingensis]
MPNSLGLRINVGYRQIELLMARAGIKGLPGNRRLGRSPSTISRKLVGGSHRSTSRAAA